MGKRGSVGRERESELERVRRAGVGEGAGDGRKKGREAGS